MNRKTLAKIHGITGGLAFLFIASFWISTLISEVFLNHAAIVVVKQTILYAFIMFIPCIMICGILGMKMGGKSQYAPIAAKRKRMPIISLNGLVILLPCAFFLYFRAKIGQFDGVFYAIQALELIAGALNLTLMGLSIKNGLSLRKK